MAAPLQLVVEDHGCGMAEDVARRALEPFFPTKARGTGLGLFNAKEIVEKHGGKIWAESAEGKWANFLFTIPKEDERR